MRIYKSLIKISDPLLIQKNIQPYSLVQKRSLSLFHQFFIGSPTSSNKQIKQDLDRAIKLVQKYDPVGYLPGLLVTNQARLGYFAGKCVYTMSFSYINIEKNYHQTYHDVSLVRAFWIDSGLRFEEKQHPNNDIRESKQIAGIGQKSIEIPDDVRLQKWNDGIASLFDSNTDSLWEKDSTLRLLNHVMQQHSLSRKYFDQILLGRKIDVDTKQYTSMESLKNHVEMSCGSLLYLVLECANIYQNNEENRIIFDAARHIGITHGLSNALRLSVPKASSTGKIIVPQELCDKYNIKSPRYLLSALGMGDEECKQHLQSAVRDIAELSRDHLKSARLLRNEILAQKRGRDALSTFLPALASETFLNRLERHSFDLQDRKLRNVGIIEHLSCTLSMLSASQQKRF